MTLPEYLDIPVRSAVVYLALLVGLRLAGKRHSGQLSPHDFVLILLVSNAVQNAMVGNSYSLGGGLLAAATLIALNVFLSRFVLRHRWWGPILGGAPTLLVHRGCTVDAHLDREGILPEELEAQVRAHGFESISQVKTAIQECDGSISVIGYDREREATMPAMSPQGRQGRGRRHR